jgi:decaprenyl-phosphate phosphoribosyltransferase
MMSRTRQAGQDRPAATAAAVAVSAWPVTLAASLLAVIQGARPRQWLKNLLVFAAPLAGATLGRDDGFGYALVAFAAFTAAASAVYLINDVLDADRDRKHPTKRLRPVASGRLPALVAVALAVAGLSVAIAASLYIGEPSLAVVVSGYAVASVLYSLGLKHVPGIELGFVALGFVLRAIGGAVATHVPPSGWFLTMCSLGALLVAIGKRYVELSALGSIAAVAHRPAMRWYTLAGLRAAQRIATVIMLAAYLLWALGEPSTWMRGWHLASVLPLALALARFDRLTGIAEGRPVEDLISKDPVMVCCELTWLALFTVGL